MRLPKQYRQLVSINCLPIQYRLASIDCVAFEGLYRHEAVLFHESITLRVAWVSHLCKLNICHGSLVAPQWLGSTICPSGLIIIEDLLRVKEIIDDPRNRYYYGTATHISLAELRKIHLK